MNDWTRVFFACALGAFLGAFIALDVRPALWWVGLIAGGFVGYVAYDPIAVLRAIPTAFLVAYEGIKEGLAEMVPWITWPRPVFYGSLALSVLPYYFWAVPMIKSTANPQAPFAALVLVHMMWWAMILFAGLFLLWVPAQFGEAYSGVWVTTFKRPDPEDPEYNPLRGEGCRIVRPNYHATAYFVLIGYWSILRFFVWDLWAALVRGVYIGAIFCTSFSVHLFQLVHSDLRLLCMTDAAIGAAVGYYAGSATIGAFAGAIFGVANYEIVSKRILRIQFEKSPS